MPGLTLGAFAGGVGQGIEQGQDIRERYTRMAAQQLAKKADQNYSAFLEQQSQPKPAAPPQIPTGPQAAPQPMGAPAPQGMPPGSTPTPPQPMGAPAAPAAPQGGPPMAGPLKPVPMPGATPMAGSPKPQAPPSAAPAAPQGGDPSGSKVPDFKEVMGQSQAYIQETAKAIAAAFPGKKWEPGELLATVDSVVQHSEKLDPIGKQLAALQVRYYTQQMETGSKEHIQDSKNQTAEDIQAAKDKEDAERYRALIAGREDVARIGAGSRVQAAGIGAGARVQAAGIGAGAREYSADTAAGASEYGADARAGASEYGAETGADARVGAAQAASGQAPTAPTRVRPALPARPLPGRSGGGAPSGGGNAPPPEAVKLLSKNPTRQMRAHFDEVFGPGAAAKALGQ